MKIDFDIFSESVCTVTNDTTTHNRGNLWSHQLRPPCFPSTRVRQAPGTVGRGEESEPTRVCVQLGIRRSLWGLQRSFGGDHQISDAWGGSLSQEQFNRFQVNTV